MKLIDADTLKENICEHVYPLADYFNTTDYGMFWTGGIEKMIDEQPTIDAVPVVRCKDCEYYCYEELGHRCVYDQYVETGEEFCSWAKRKEE